MDPKPSIKRCQSCGMPLTEEFYGTNADSTPNEEYCKLCYVDGAFTDPTITMDGMIQKSIKQQMRDITVSEEQAEVMANATVPSLKRWNKAGPGKSVN